MIIHIQSGTTESAAAAREDLDDLANSWGQPINDVSTDTIDALGRDAVAEAQEDQHGGYGDPYSTVVGQLVRGGTLKGDRGCQKSIRSLSFPTHSVWK